jgi:hypothetical protein
MAKKEGNVKEGQEMFASLFHAEGKLLGLEESPYEQPEKSEKESKKETARIAGVEGDGYEQTQEKPYDPLLWRNPRQSEGIELLQAEVSQKKDEEKKEPGGGIDNKQD